MVKLADENEDDYTSMRVRKDVKDELDRLGQRHETLSQILERILKERHKK